MAGVVEATDIQALAGAPVVSALDLAIEAWLDETANRTASAQASGRRATLAQPAR